MAVRLPHIEAKETAEIRREAALATGTLRATSAWARGGWTWGGLSGPRPRREKNGVNR